MSGPKALRPEASRAVHAAQTDARSRLARSGYSALRHVECEVAHDRALLSGNVPSYYLKQLAQAIVSGVDGVRNVENRIRVG